MFPGVFLGNILFAVNFYKNITNVEKRSIFLLIINIVLKVFRLIHKIIDKIDVIGCITCIFIVDIYYLWFYIYSRILLHITDIYWYLIIIIHIFIFIVLHRKLSTYLHRLYAWRCFSKFFYNLYIKLWLYKLIDVIKYRVDIR